MMQGKLAANSLVRYRGMVQDQYEPEYFVGSFEEVETATGQRSRVDVKYVDSIAQRPGYVNEYDGPGAKTMDRCVSLFLVVVFPVFSTNTPMCLWRKYIIPFSSFFLFLLAGCNFYL